MEKNKRWVNGFSTLLFSFGVLIGIALTVVNVWGDLEAGMFDTLIQAEEGISSLNCPAMITTSETATVSASFTNTHVRAVERNIRVHISDGNATLMREELSKLPLTPGKTEKLHWIVNPEDAAYDQFILVRVYLFPKAPLPAQDGSCGIMVVNFPFLSGGQILTVSYVASILFLSIGTVLWVTKNKPIRGSLQIKFRAIVFLFGSVTAGMVVSHMGWWMIGVICLAITVILIFSIPSQLAAQ
jgi:hypothetical protein